MSADSLSLAGKSALITGSGRENGVGAAIARTFAKNGAAVAIHYISDSSKARAEKVAANISKEFGTKTTIVHGDVAKQDVAHEMVAQTLKGLGVDHLDILINNAATGSNEPLLEASAEHINFSLGVHVHGPMFMTQAAVKTGKMPHGGRIVNVGTIVSKMGLTNGSVYAASKAATDSLTASWAGELGKSHGITVNVVALGPIPTDSSRPFLVGDDGNASEMSAGMLAMTRGGDRLGTTADAADAVLLLVSEKSRWITAQYISVSGGIVATM